MTTIDYIESHFKAELKFEENSLLSKGCKANSIHQKAIDIILKKADGKVRSFDFKNIHLVTEYLCVSMDLWSTEKIKVDLTKRTFEIIHKDISYKAYLELTKDCLPSYNTREGKVFDFGGFKEAYKWLRVNFKEVRHDNN